MSRPWTSRELDIVETLTRKVCVLSLDQIARGWWRNETHPELARHRLGRLLQSGLLERSMANAHPPLPVRGPLVHWEETHDAPDFEAVARRAKARWDRAAVPTEIYTASRLAANLFGSNAGSPPRLCHRDHDLLLAEVYVRYRLERPEEARRWVGEDALPKAGYRVKDPDAFLVAGGRPVRVIESAGRYDARQVASFHAHCAARGLPYELW